MLGLYSLGEASLGSLLDDGVSFLATADIVITASGSLTFFTSLLAGNVNIDISSTADLLAISGSVWIVQPDSSTTWVEQTDSTTTWTVL